MCLFCWCCDAAANRFYRSFVSTERNNADFAVDMMPITELVLNEIKIKEEENEV